MDVFDEEMGDVNYDPFPFVSTASENGSTFVNALKGDTIGEFLSRDKYIPVRSCSLTDAEDYCLIDYKPDIDGVVIEWKHLSGTAQRVSRLQLVPPKNICLKYMYAVIKKHLDLAQFNANSRHMLRYCVANQLYYNDGWETWLGFIPQHDCEISYPKEVLRTLSLKTMYEVKAETQRIMRYVRGKHFADNTLVKNNLNDLSTITILPDDQLPVMMAFEAALEKSSCFSGFRPMLITFRFGDKCHTGLELPIAINETVERVSVHVGLEVGASFPKYEYLNEPSSSMWNLLWSRDGVHQVVGNRGYVWKAFSFSECVNYQSNLDGRRMDIINELRAVCIMPERMHYVQLYADLPHRLPKCRMHPVSAAVIMPNGVGSTRSSSASDAKHYISELQNNFANLYNCRCRLEFVMAMPVENLPETLIAGELIDLENVRTLLQTYPLLTPFRHSEFLASLRVIGLHLVGELQELLSQFCGTGHSTASWKAYQTELAVEKLLWGRPLCSKSRNYAINLGPGIDYPSRSRTDAMGFLSLELATTCCEDEFTTPPLVIYSGSECVQGQIARVFGLADVLDGSSSVVIGRHLVMLLVKDLYAIGKVHLSYADFYLFLKTSTPDIATSVVGATTVKQLIQLLLSAKKGTFPMVFVHVVRLMQKKNVDLLKCFVAGLLDLGLIYFPAVRVYDHALTARLFWRWNHGLWAITDIGNVNGEDSLIAKEIVLRPLIVRELEKRRLCHSSTLANLLLPWIKPCLVKLGDKKLSNEELVVVLTFVTCVALLMNGRYVDYNRLSHLDMELPVKQRDLQSVEISSKYLLNNFNKFRLWRLHHSLPFKLTGNACYKANDIEQITHVEDEHEPVNMEPIYHISDQLEDAQYTEFAAARPVLHLPGNCRRSWSPVEMSIIGNISQKYFDRPQKEQYRLYQKECIEMGIPDRSLNAFRFKLSRFSRV